MLINIFKHQDDIHDGNMLLIQGAFVKHSMEVNSRVSVLSLLGSEKAIVRGRAMHCFMILSFSVSLPFSPSVVSLVPPFSFSTLVHRHSTYSTLA